jgi:putative PIN family toxin of toxin-antitoxin system
MKVVIDTSVYVAALISTTGAPTQVVAAIATGRLEVIVSPLLLDELASVLARDKFRRFVSADAGATFVTELARRAELHPDVDQPPKVTRDVDDDYLVALAAAHQALLVSVDKDLLDAGLVPPVLNPRQLLHLLDKE